MKVCNVADGGFILFCKFSAMLNLHLVIYSIFFFKRVSGANVDLGGIVHWGEKKIPASIAFT